MRGDPLLSISKCRCGLPFKGSRGARYCEHCDRPCFRRHVPVCDQPCILHRTENCPTPCLKACRNVEHQCRFCSEIKLTL